MHVTAKFQNYLLPNRTSSSCTRKSAGGSRPPCLGEPQGPQGRVQQLADVVRVVLVLHIPVPQVGHQLVASLKHLDEPIPEQVIEVPKISSSSRRSRMRRSRMVLLEPQTAEQLVEVPTAVSFSSLQQTAEQVIDIPVPRTRGNRGGLQSFFSRTKVRRSVLQSRSSTFLLVVVFKIFSPTLGCQPHPQSRVMRRFKGFFAFSPSSKSAKFAGCTGTRVHGRQRLVRPRSP